MSGTRDTSRNARGGAPDAVLLRQVTTDSDGTPVGRIEATAAGSLPHVPCGTRGLRWIGASRAGTRPTTVGPVPSAVPARSGWASGGGFHLDAVPGVADLELAGPPEAAVHELSRLDDAVWRHGFVAYLRHRHEAEAAGDAHPTGVKLESYLALASDARVLRKTRAVIEAAHRGRVLSLAELARAGDGPVEDRRKREVGLRRRVLWPMDELGAWDVTEVPRASRPASGAARGVLRYEIGAGPALVAFDALHHRPWLLRQFERLDAVLRRAGETPARV